MDQAGALRLPFFRTADEVAMNNITTVRAFDGRRKRRSIQHRLPSIAEQTELPESQCSNQADSSCQRELPPPCFIAESSSSSSAQASETEKLMNAIEVETAKEEPALTQSSPYLLFTQSPAEYHVLMEFREWKRRRNERLDKETKSIAIQCSYDDEGNPIPYREIF